MTKTTPKATTKVTTDSVAITITEENVYVDGELVPCKAKLDVPQRQADFLIKHKVAKEND